MIAIEPFARSQTRSSFAGIWDVPESKAKPMLAANNNIACAVNLRGLMSARILVLGAVDQHDWGSWLQLRNHRLGLARYHRRSRNRNQIFIEIGHIGILILSI